MDYSTHVLPVVESRVDWITATARRGERARDLSTYADTQIGAAEAEGDRPARFRFQGYEGRACGRWRLGERRDGVLVQVSGWDAADYAETLADLADHWSRIDYAVSVDLENSGLDPGRDYWENWQWKEEPLKAPISFGRIQEFGGGQTVHWGNRGSAYYLRCYDKHHESRGQYKRGIWRWEVELKQHASEVEHRRALSMGIDQGLPLRYVQSELARYNVAVPWSVEARVERAARVVAPRDAERVLDWLYRQVGPAARFAAR